MVAFLIWTECLNVEFWVQNRRDFPKPDSKVGQVSLVLAADTHANSGCISLVWRLLSHLTAFLAWELLHCFISLWLIFPHLRTAACFLWKSQWKRVNHHLSYTHTHLRSTKSKSVHFTFFYSTSRQLMRGECFLSSGWNETFSPRTIHNHNIWMRYNFW